MSLQLHSAYLACVLAKAGAHCMAVGQQTQLPGRGPVNCELLVLAVHLVQPIKGSSGMVCRPPRNWA